MKDYVIGDEPLKVLIKDAIWALSHRQRYQMRQAIWSGLILHRAPCSRAEMRWVEGVMWYAMMLNGWITIQHALPGFGARDTFWVTPLGIEVASNGPS